MISADEQESLALAIREVESDTAGEIVLVVARAGRAITGSFRCYGRCLVAFSSHGR